jgi:hypoxanthine phosphoribosyltransferase
MHDAQHARHHLGGEEVEVLLPADLVREIDLPLGLDFVGLSSCVGAQTSGQIEPTSDLARPIEGKDVILVEDIVDTGLTMQWLIRNFQARGAASVAVCALLVKA